MMTTNYNYTVGDTTSRTADSRLAPRSESGIANLRRRIAGDAAAGNAIGLGDPFAEIFASIATADARTPPSVEPVDTKPFDENDTTARSEKDESVDKSEEAQESEEPRVSEEAQESEEPRVSEEAQESEEPRGSEEAQKPQESEEAQESEEPQEFEESKTDAETVPAQSLEPLRIAAETESDETEEAVALPPDEQPDLNEPSDAKKSEENVTLQTDADDQPDLQDETVQLKTAGAEENVDESVAEPEGEPEGEPEIVVAANSNQDRKRSKAETASTDEVPTAAEEAPLVEPIRVRSDSDEKAREGDVPDERPAATDRSDAAATRVERRRYSDSSDQPGARDSNPQTDATTADETKTGIAPRSETAGQRNRSATESGGQGIDISGMTAVSSASTLNPAATAALTSVSRAARASSAGVTGKTAAAASGAGNSPTPAGDFGSAFGVDSPGKTGGETKDAATKPSVGVDTSAAVARAKLVQRISRGFQHLGTGGGQIRMKLSPDHLGTVQLQMTIRDGKLNGRMITQSDNATEVLREQLPGLRASLESQGIRMERIDIETETGANLSENQSESRQSREGAGGFSDQQFDRQQNFAGGRHRSGWSDVNATRSAERATAPLASPSPIGSLANLSGRVDLHV